MSQQKITATPFPLVWKDQFGNDEKEQVSTGYDLKFSVYKWGNLWHLKVHKDNKEHAYKASTSEEDIKEQAQIILEKRINYELWKITTAAHLQVSLAS